MKVFSLKLPHRGDSNEYTKYTIFSINKEIYPKLSFNNLQLWDFSKGLKSMLQTAMVNEPSVFKPLKVYCNVSKSAYTWISFQKNGEEVYIRRGICFLKINMQCTSIEKVYLTILSSISAMELQLKSTYLMCSHGVTTTDPSSAFQCGMSCNNRS